MKEEKRQRITQCLEQLELACWAHVRRKFFELHVATKSSLAQEMVHHIGQLYSIERQCREGNLDVQAITQLRREQVTAGTAYQLLACFFSQRISPPSHGSFS